MCDKWIALPNHRVGITKKVEVGKMDLYITVNFIAEYTIPVEVFCKVAKMGSTVQGFVNGFTTALSIGLRSGAPWHKFYEKLHDRAFEPKDEIYPSILAAIITTIDDAINEWHGHLVRVLETTIQELETNDAENDSK